MINKSLFTLCFLLIALGSLFTFVASDSEAFETKFKKFVSRNSGKCLDIRGGSKRNMASLIQWDCHGGGNQQFKITKMGSRNNNDVVAII
ncbi:MAG: RICIN domain-containing protein, partial [bacterium]|nr:RICIN domain-containing protein [bacterium]